MGCPKEVPPMFDLFVTVAKMQYIAAIPLGVYQQYKVLHGKWKRLKV